jgi:tetratricopeptide (TPR) repeat protein
VAALIAVTALALAGLGSFGVWYNARESRRLDAAREEVEQTLTDARADFWAEQWDLAASHLHDALKRIDATPSLAPLRPQAEQMLAETEARGYSADAWRRFTRARDDALFHRLEFLSLGDVGDKGARLAAAGESARQALAVIGLDPQGDGPWEPDARFEADRRAQLVTDGSTLLLVSADVSSERGRFAEALRALDRAGRVGARSRVLLLRRAACLRALGETEAARENERQAADLSPATAWDYFLLGDEAYRHGDLAGAVRAFETAVGLRADDFWSEFVLARCYADLKAWDRARACLTVCRILRPNLVWVHLLLGYVHREAGALTVAEADLARAEELLEGDGDVNPRFSLHLNRGMLRLRQGRPEAAIADVTVAAQLRPDDWGPHMNLARIYDQMRQKDEAEKELRAVLDRNPPPVALADYHALRGRDLYLGQQYEDAVAGCRAALRERDGHTLALGYLGQSLLKLGRYEEAAAAFASYLEKGGQAVPDIYRGRGQARMKLGDYLGARDDYTRVILERPGAEIYEYRGWAYFFADAWQPALRDFDEAVRLDPQRGDAYTGRGLTRVMLGRYREAVGDADEALRRKPDAPEMMHNLACVFAQAAARAEADTATDRLTLAADYRERAVRAVRATLALVPAPGRAAFLRDSVVPDRALDPIRQVPAFRELLKEYQLDRAPK